jgi:hypothetical protein
MKVERLLPRLFSTGIYRIGTVAISALLAMGTARTAPAQTTNLIPNSGTISLSQLLGPSAVSVQVGDKLFSDFEYIPSNGTGNPANDLPAGAIVVSALSNPFGFGISFSGPFVPTGNTTNDIVLKYSVAVTDPHQLISDVHLGFNGAVVGAGLAQVTEQIMTNGFGTDTVALLNVYNNGLPNPAFNDVVVLLQPREKLFIQKDILFGGGGSLSIIDQTFSQIPEPSTLVLAGAGCFALLALRRRKRPTAR